MPHSFTTPRLLLRPVTPRDAKPFWRIANDPAQTRNTGSWRAPFTPEDVVGRWQSGEGFYSADSVLFAILMGGRFAGVTGLHCPKDGAAELSYWVGSAFAGRGIASEAAGALCRHGFRQRRLERITARVFEDNLPSRRILTKLGFKVTGRNMGFSLQRGGESPSISMVLHERR